MTRTISQSIKKDNGTTRNIIIEPVMTQSANDKLDLTGIYTLYKDTDKQKMDLLEIQEIAPEIGESKPLLDDKNNPDFLGQIIFKNDGSEWQYIKGSLSINELEQIVSFIQNTHSQN
ncbi:hypothetical protein [Mucilaginibacter lappiensis]|jgi:hypothetical protein|uniref:hypothetical protein n=1 Tax=Mucilaginibacter lappiensis TaxID=354630 RepID=UPI003D1A155D